MVYRLIVKEKKGKDVTAFILNEGYIVNDPFPNGWMFQFCKFGLQLHVKELIDWILTRFIFQIKSQQNNSGILYSSIVFETEKWSDLWNLEQIPQPESTTITLNWNRFSEFLCWNHELPLLKLTLHFFSPSHLFYLRLWELLFVHRMLNASLVHVLMMSGR